MIGFVDPDHAGPEGLHAPSELLQDWKAILARRVPSYMVPSELLICHGFPMSQTDKADRKKLEQMYRESRTSAATKPGAQPAQRTGQPA